MKRYEGIVNIGIATFASWIIANLPTGRDPGLGFMTNWFLPLIVGGVGIIVFIILSLVSKRKSHWLILCLAWSAYLVYVGIAIHVDKGWPFVYW